MRTLSAALCILLATVVAAGEPAIVIDGNGHYYYGDGTGEMTRVPNVYRLPGAPDDPGGGDNPGDDGGDNDDDPPPSNLRSQVKGWALAVNRPNDARIMAAAYGLLADQLESGKIPSDNNSVNKAQKQAFDLVFAADGPTRLDFTKWKTFYENVLDVQGPMVQRTPTKAEWVAHFRSVSGGLQDSTAGNALPGWLQPIIDALIQALLQLLLNLFNSNATAEAPQPDLPIPVRTDTFTRTVSTPATTPMAMMLGVSDAKATEWMRIWAQYGDADTRRRARQYLALYDH